VDSNPDVDVFPRAKWMAPAVGGTLAAGALGASIYGVVEGTKATVDSGLKRTFEAFEGRVNAELVDK